MELYTRPQLLLMLSLLAAAGVGLGVSHWRAAHPQLVERLEQVEREIAASDEVGPENRDVARVADGTRAPAERRRAEPESRPPRRPRAPKRQGLSREEPGPPLDLNRATPADLMRLPGVGPVLARRIVEAREAAGRFGAVDDLGAVRGLGGAKLERLRPFVGVSE
jgi:competence ComEA-like helix-hairpin-helix protein